MATYLRKFLVLVSYSAAAILLAAWVTHRAESLRRSAARLNDASNRFSAQLRYQGETAMGMRIPQPGVTKWVELERCFS